MKPNKLINQLNFVIIVDVLNGESSFHSITKAQAYPRDPWCGGARGRGVGLGYVRRSEQKVESISTIPTYLPEVSF